MKWNEKLTYYLIFIELKYYTKNLRMIASEISFTQGALELSCSCKLPLTHDHAAVLPWEAEISELDLSNFMVRSVLRTLYGANFWCVFQSWRFIWLIFYKFVDVSQRVLYLYVGDGTRPLIRKVPTLSLL